MADVTEIKGIPMKRTRLHSLDQESARKRIRTAKSNKPFMTALLDRGHRGHKDAVDQWTRLHQVASSDAGDPDSAAQSDDALPIANHASAPSADGRRRHGVTETSGGASQSGSRAMPAVADRRKPTNNQANTKRSDVRENRTGSLVLDPERPPRIGPEILSPLLRRSAESESAWLNRIVAEIDGSDASLQRLVAIREAMLREIGFYDVGRRQLGPDGMMSEADWNVLAALQNVPVDGWQDAHSLGEHAREEFEQTGFISAAGVLGPDGNIYSRLSFRQEHPVGGILGSVDELIRMKQQANSTFDPASVLPAIAVAPVALGRGVPPRSRLAETVAPRDNAFIRSHRGAATVGLATGGGAALVGDAAMERRARSEMDAAPDLPPVPGLEPPERPETERESFPADLPPIPPLPGFMPEDYPNLVEVFPDQRGDLPLVDILDNRLGNEETQLFNTNTMRGVRNLARDIGVKLRHIGGGQPSDESDYREPELHLRPSGGGRAGASYLDIAFKSERTRRMLMINTVDTRADNVTLTGREERAAARILVNSETGHILVTLAKPPRGQAYSLDRFLEWIRPLVEEIDRDLPEGPQGHQRRFDFR